MSNCILAYPDKLLGITGFSGGSWSASFPLTNLADSSLALKARSSNPLETSTRFDVNFGSAKPIRVIAICGHNLSINAKVQIQLSNNISFPAPLLYDSTQISCYPSYYDDSSLDYGEPELTGGKVSSATALAMRYPVFVVTSAPISAQFMRVMISDTGNSAGYIELARCFAGPGLQPLLNMNTDLKLGLAGRTKKDEALDGTPWFNRIEARKTVQFTLPHVAPEDGIGRHLQLARSADINQEIFFVSNPDATSMSMRSESFLGRLTQLAGYQYVAYNRGDVGYQIEEAV